MQDISSIDTLQNIQESGFQLLDKLSPKFFLRLCIDLIATTVLVRFIYYRTYHKTEQFFTFFSFNITIFLITNLLNNVEMSMGAAFGLFAVFSMLRYRTESISTRDMTYLFLVIAIGLLSAVSKGGWDELTALNAILLIMTSILESKWLVKKEHSKAIIYERIELIHIDKRQELLKDLQNRTGLKVQRVEIESIDFLRDATRMIIYYFD
ncbi:DUF4956 domain-containing protein [Arcicella sp. DC25W]|uniref:DUF4956 domain-containing protein n=1 Tax=Arcicella lustrica TaxID=2984196 RepID=A0ABU5SHX8_9BACT|nr:DUF4956 domain-containing protein [Arcicella sp. DC25W]